MHRGTDGLTCTRRDDSQQFSDRTKGPSLLTFV
jgi:hypothetical protein